MSANTFFCIDPRTGLATGSYNYSSEAEIDAAISSLHKSFLKWKKISLPEKKLFFVRLSAAIEAKKNDFASLISAEMGKPLTDAHAEVNKCLKTLEKLQEMSLEMLAARELRVGLNRAQIQHEPLGVIYSIMPWNYPLWQVIRMAVPTLMSGNTVLLKHSDLVPRLALLIEEVFTEASPGLPLLLHRHINHERSDNILSRTEIGGVSLTGSVRAGREVYLCAARNLKKCVLELGGSDPYIVLADAKIKSAAKKIMKSRLLNNGQTCISAKRALIHSSQLQKFIEEIGVEIESYQIGDSAQLGPLAHPQFKKNLQLQLSDLRRETGAALIFKKTAQYPPAEESAYVDIEVYLLEKHSDWLKSQEFFGPVLVIIPFETVDEAVQMANATDFGLGAAVFSENLTLAFEVANQLQAGQVAINDLISTDLSLPFGGFKMSGLGRELGDESFLEFTQTKVITVPVQEKIRERS